MRRFWTSSSRTTYRFGLWLQGPSGVRAIFLLLWLLSVVLVAEYAIRQTVAVVDLSTIRMVNQAQISCELAEEAFRAEQWQYKELMKMADKCVVWKDAGPSF